MSFLTRRLGVCLLLLALALLLGAGTAWAQAGTSTIRGVVTDPQGKVVPEATVTIKNIDTGFTRTQKTTDTGTFSFDLIPAGDYNVEVEAAGFSKKLLSGLHAIVGTAVDASTQLQVGAVTAVIQVESTPTEVMVNTQDATLGNNFVNSQIVQLPMEARNVQSLLTLQPGVTPEGYVAGARSDQSNITLDGVDINEAQTNDLGSPVLRLNSEAIEEFRVTTVGANANQGRSSAAQVNLVTKSGSNNFHGSLFEYHRNTIFTANNFFNNRAVPRVPRPKLIRNTYGGTVGGPIMKDRLFFFYSFEGRRDASATSVVRIVPLAILGQGQMVVPAQNCPTPTTCGPTQNVTLTTAQLNTIFNVVGTNPTAITALQAAATAYVANDTTQGDGLNTGGYRFNATTPVDNNSNVAKIDWNINSKMTAFVRMNTIYDLAGQAPQFPDTPRPSRWEHPWGLVASHNWTMARNWVNNFRYGFTRQAFSQQGDSADNAISFRFVFSPRSFARTLARTTPVHNIVDDISWIHGSHTVQFGTNIRVTRNSRTNFANAYDSAITNPSFYQAGGNVISDPILAFLTANFGLNKLVNKSATQNGATALIGRYSQYSARFTFGASGTLLASGTPTERTFATEEYDFYVQDSWKIRPNLTLNVGLRYGLSRPVYEKGGFGVVTDISGAEYLRRRIKGAAAGTPYTALLSLDKAGGTGKGPLYNWDKNNFQPRVSVAWSPRYENSFLRAIFGEGGKSVLRAGFAMTNDYYGQALAVLFDLNNTLGFTSNTTISANTYNVTTRPAPLFTGYNQQVRPLPGIVVPGPISFPRQQPADQRRRIEGGLDTELTAPLNYLWNFTFEREFPKGFLVQAAYIGRLGRKLLATRDVMALNNLVDPASKMDWYTAATLLEVQRQLGTPTTSIAPIPYFQNLFPANMATLLNNCCGYSMPTTGIGAYTATQAIYEQAFGFWGNDWTDVQDEIEAATGTPYFFNPQYGALDSWGTIGNSNFHGLTLSVRQRLRDLQWDLNYTFSHSLDDASGLQTAGAFGAGMILNPIRQHDNYASSDFDLRHVINLNAVYQLPFGRNKRFGSGVNRGVDAVIGGWQLSGIFRWNTGLPIGAPYDDVRWATNWNVQSNTTQITKVKPCPTRGTATVAPKLFGCNTQAAYESFRNAYPGETGMRNVFRLPGYVAADLGLSKSFSMPWNEKHKLQLRWEVFNVTNTQRFGDIDGSRTGYGLGDGPVLNGLTAPSNWSNFVSIQGSPRVMQIGARFEF